MHNNFRHQKRFAPQQLPMRRGDTPPIGLGSLAPFGGAANPVMGTVSPQQLMGMLQGNQGAPQFGGMPPGMQQPFNPYANPTALYTPEAYKQFGSMQPQPMGGFGEGQPPQMLIPQQLYAQPGQMPFDPYSTTTQQDMTASRSVPQQSFGQTMGQFGFPAQAQGQMQQQQPAQKPLYNFARGGQVRQPKYGLASAAEQLRRRGRNGDTILAHINPQEAAMLRRMGGSGRINPNTGLPEFGFFDDTLGLGGVKDALGDAFSWAGDTVGDAFDWVGDTVDSGLDWVGDELNNFGNSIDDAIFQPALGAANDVAEFLGPVGVIAASIYAPWAGALMAGFAAPGDDFDWKSAAKTGATSWAMQGADMGGGTEASFDYSGEFGSDPFALGDAGVEASTEAALSGADQAVIDQAVGATAADVVPTSDVSVQEIKGYAPGEKELAESYANSNQAPSSVDLPNFAATNVPASYGTGFDDMYATPTTWEEYKALNPSGPYSEEEWRKYMAEINKPPAAPIETRDFSKVPLGTPKSTTDAVIDLGESAYKAAKDVLPSSKEALGWANLGMQGLKLYSGMQALEGMKQGLKETKAQNAAAAKAAAAQEKKAAEQKARAKAVMAKWPANYKRLTAEQVKEYGLASGGRVDSFDDELGSDNTGVAAGGIMGLARGGMPPRFLSGAGDGMSDSIRARIGGRQEARLADGEFVVPADVVSHLGNGSSKAGAQQLYAMMDRIRRARTGKAKQAPQVNPRRTMPA